MGWSAVDGLWLVGGPFDGQVLPPDQIGDRVVMPRLFINSAGVNTMSDAVYELVEPGVARFTVERERAR